MNRARNLKLLFCCIAAVLLLAVCLLSEPLRVYRAAGRAEPVNLYEAALLYESLGGFFDARERADAVYAKLGVRALRLNQVGPALQYLSRLQTGDAVAAYSADLYAAASDYAARGSDAEAARIFGALGDYRDSGDQRNAALFRIADRYELSGDLISACRGFTALGNYADSAGRAQQCRQRYYRTLVDNSNETGLSSADFRREIVRDYGDSANYYRIYQLQISKWRPEDYERNMALIHELGDFEGMAQHGFLAARIMGVRFADGGHYFEIDANGNLQTNLPNYTLPGYYGLYWGINREGVYRIGSDEKDVWTPMFRLTAENNDMQLTVYCYTDGSTYTLYRTEP